MKVKRYRSGRTQQYHTVPQSVASTLLIVKIGDFRAALVNPIAEDEPECDSNFAVVPPLPSIFASCTPQLYRKLHARSSHPGNSCGNVDNI
ncbi:hypothetical protein MTP99_016609 [Tenebrio molitor]|nr:hypothetical protein MTP99_016609 [Tenebrio molitor]